MSKKLRERVARVIRKHWNEWAYVVGEVEESLTLSDKIIRALRPVKKRSEDTERIDWLALSHWRCVMPGVYGFVCKNEDPQMKGQVAMYRAPSIREAIDAAMKAERAGKAGKR